jgi:pilus assembly protein TadC
MTEALERMALRNPSIYLRRMNWQIVNALRTGSDMGATLQVILEQFTDEQRVLLQKFSKELAPWAMMYMMVTVVFPTLGITLFLILSSLSSVQLSEPVLMAFVFVSIIIQYFFIQFLKTKRPSMRW